MILIVLIQEGADDPIQFAAVPEIELAKYTLSLLNGRDVNKPRDDQQYLDDEVVEIFSRLGVESDPARKIKPDLQMYMNPTFPLQISEVVAIGWSI